MLAPCTALGTASPVSHSSGRPGSGQLLSHHRPRGLDSPPGRRPGHSRRGGGRTRIHHSCEYTKPSHCRDQNPEGTFLQTALPTSAWASGRSALLVDGGSPPRTRPPTPGEATGSTTFSCHTLEGRARKPPCPRGHGHRGGDGAPHTGDLQSRACSSRGTMALSAGGSTSNKIKQETKPRDIGDFVQENLAPNAHPQTSTSKCERPPQVSSPAGTLNGASRPRPRSLPSTIRALQARGCARQPQKLPPLSHPKRTEAAGQGRQPTSATFVPMTPGRRGWDAPEKAACLCAYLGAAYLGAAPPLPGRRPRPLRACRRGLPWPSPQGSPCSRTGCCAC